MVSGDYSSYMSFVYVPQILRRNDGQLFKTLLVSREGEPPRDFLLHFFRGALVKSSLYHHTNVVILDRLPRVLEVPVEHEPCHLKLGLGAGAGFSLENCLQRTGPLQKVFRRTVTQLAEFLLVGVRLLDSFSWRLRNIVHILILLSTGFYITWVVVSGINLKSNGIVSPMSSSPRTCGMKQMEGEEESLKFLSASSNLHKSYNC